MTANSSVDEPLMWCSFENEDADDDDDYLSLLRCGHNLNKSYCFGACGQRNSEKKSL